jgi:osmoprotectant transport system substrate-binding protein
MSLRPVFLLLLLAFVAGACGGEDEPAAEPAKTPQAPTVRLGTKDFSEQYILGELYAQALRAKGFKVELKPDIGSSEIVDKALTLGSIDMYPEYTGVLLSEIAQQPERPKTAEAAYKRAKNFQEGRGFTLLAMTPFENANAIAVKPEFAERNGVRTIADLGKIRGRATIGAPPEFRTRYEGLEGLQKVYGLDKLRVRAIQIGRQYRELDRGGVDAVAVFSTDGQLGAGEYRVLEDPKRLFSFQNVAPVISRKLLDSSPELAAAADAVSAKLTTEAMQEMNAAVAIDGQTPTVVAEKFLSENDLL